MTACSANCWVGLDSAVSGCVPARPELTAPGCPSQPTRNRQASNNTGKRCRAYSCRDGLRAESLTGGDGTKYSTEYVLQVDSRDGLE